MSNKEFSKAQLEIINAPIDNILVSAAAGSGKTTVLVERIVTKLIKQELSINEILVVTFTRDAAVNMRKKIEDRLRDEITRRRALGEDISFLEKQMDYLPNSYIQTLDSFCSRVIKEKGYVCASEDEDYIDSSSVILDENELKLILMASADAAIESFYYDEDVDSNFITLTNMFGDGRTDDSLKDVVVEAYSKLRSLPDYISRSEEYLAERKKYDDSDSIIGIDFAVNKLLNLLKKIDDELVAKLKLQISGLSFLVDSQKNIARQEEFYTLLDILKQYSKEIISLSEVKSSVELIGIIRESETIKQLDSDMIPAVNFSKNNRNTSYDVYNFQLDYSPVAALVCFLKDSKIISMDRNKGGYLDSALPNRLIEAVPEFFKRDPHGLLECQKNRTKMIEAFINIIKRTDKLYSENKKNAYGMDFPDQSHYAKKILSYVEASSYYRTKFREVYIDEYQDNSEIQDSIIDCFTSNENKVFRVGDVKQSIYRFRYANPELFMNLAHLYSENQNSGRLLLLNNNYRSEKSVLDFINVIFERIMNEEGSGIEYDENQRLNFPGNKESRASESDVRVNIVTYEDSTNEKQAMLQGVLNEVNHFLSINKSYSDICVLTRTNVGSSLVSEYLNANGIPSLYLEELSVFDDNDIHGICNVIYVVGNEYRDEYLMGILLSPYRYSNFTLEEVSEVIRSVKANNSKIHSQSLMEKLRYYSNSDSSNSDLKVRVQKFIDWIDNLRNEQILTDIGELTDAIYEQTGIGATLKDDSEKLVMFKEWLCSNFIRYGSDISGIASELENMKIKLGSKASIRKKDGSQANAVRCMTYHSSKGLEFEAVIVTELNQQKRNNSLKDIVYDSASGFVCCDFNNDTVRKDQSLDQVLFEDDNNLADNSEGLRLLYVALTRAVSNLSVVMSINPESKSFIKSTNLIQAYSNKELNRDYWLLSNRSLEFAFLSGLMNLSGAHELRSLLYDDELIDDECLTDYSDFELVINDFVVEDSNTIDTSSETNFEDYNENSEVSDVGSESDVVKGVANKEMSGDVSLCTVETDENGKLIIPAYKYQEASELPFKMSVSSMKYGIKPSSSISLEMNGVEYYMNRINGDIGDSPSEIGTFLHRILRFIDLNSIKNNDSSYESEIDGLIRDRIISARDKSKALAFETGVVSLATSDIGARLIASDLNGDAQYEKPILFSVKTEDDTDNVLVQGIIDVLFMESDGEYVLIDYKTDKLSDCVTYEERVTEVVNKHSFQLNSYASAIESAGHKVKEKYIYLVNYGEFISVYDGVL